MNPIDLVGKLLRYDHQERLTAKEAQAHPYFTPLREAEARSDGATSGGASASGSSGP